MKTENWIEIIAGIVAVVLLVAGCFVIIRPFLVAVMWAAILCFSTWPLYCWMQHACRQRRNLAATLMTILITLVVVAPLIMIGFSLASDARDVVVRLRSLLQEGPPDLPAWIARIPLVGSMLDSYWAGFAHNGEQLLQLLKDLTLRWRGWFIQRGLDLGHGFFQLLLSVFVSFFFYRDGVQVVDKLQEAIRRIVGDQTQHLLTLVGGTVKSVVYGILGTALAQGALAGIGFWIAGVPLPLLLGLITFLLALLPMGPPLVWIPAVLWLFHVGKMGWGIFMLIWGFFVISGVDNVLKPYLISRGSNLPFILVFIGVLGGIMGFGFIGIFIGPTLLAVGYSLLTEWSLGGNDDRA